MYLCLYTENEITVWNINAWKDYGIAEKRGRLQEKKDCGL